MLVCRVLLGVPKVAQETLAPPAGNAQLATRRLDEGFHSLVVTPGQLPSQGATHQQSHHEYVVFSRDQVYPEYLVRFRVPGTE